MLPFKRVQVQRLCLGLVKLQLLLVGSVRHDMHLRKALPMLTKELIYALFCNFVERACARCIDLDGLVPVYSRHM